MDAFGYEEPAWAVDPSEENDSNDADNADDTKNNDSSGEEAFGAEHLLLLFDCDASMFEQYVTCLSDDGEDQHFVSPMDVATTAAWKFVRTKIRDMAETKSGKRDGVGVLLYGCDPKRAMRTNKASSPAPDTNASSDSDDEMEELPPIYELLELKPPGTDSVLAIQECLPPPENPKKQRSLRDEFSTPPKRKEGKKGEDDEDDDGDGVECSLFRGLTAASKIFDNAKCVKVVSATSKELPDSKAVWIFTNQDDPCHGQEYQKQRLLNQVKKDLNDANVSIHVMPLPKKSSGGTEPGDFDQGIFYNELTSPYKRVEDVKDSETGAVDLEALVERFEYNAKKRRKYGSIPLLLPGWKEREDNPGIMLDLYSAVQVRSKPAKIPVHQEKNKATKRVTKRIITQSGEEVQKEDIHHFADFSGRVSLQPANIATMKMLSNSLDITGLLIHGFRPLKFLPTTNLMSRTILALANDARVQGSGKALNNLKQSMRKKGVFAVGEMLLRVSATSKMVALVPQDDECGGFYIMQLPFKEDVRTVSKSDIGFANRKSVDAAKDMITKSTLRFDDPLVTCLPPNPLLKHFFGFLESLSLGKPLPEKEDEAKMDEQQMLDSAGEQIQTFAASLPEDEQTSKKGTKRKTPSAALKPEPIKEKISDEWIEMYKNNEIADLKNDKLKAFLKSQGERLGGKKSDLVDRIHRCIEKEVFKE